MNKKRKLEAIICPNCHRGTLEDLSKQEKKNNDLDVKTNYYGCDECKYIVDKKYLDI
jgi:hypothetical protein